MPPPPSVCCCVVEEFWHSLIYNVRSVLLSHLFMHILRCHLGLGSKTINAIITILFSTAAYDSVNINWIELIQSKIIAQDSVMSLWTV